MRGIRIKTALLLIAIGWNTPLFASGEIIPCKGKFDSRFLIVVDRESFVAAKEEILDYKATLEHEGLGTVILIGEWNNPEGLREEIRDIYKGKPVLEGAVFMGKIPVVRIQNFQHGTTAFKMNESAFPIFEASVTSDRFYDDLDLEFGLIREDEKNPGQFYYRLREDSPQEINSDFYSARMMPPSDMGISPAVLLKRYLKKVVAAHKEVNPLDRLVIFNGHGYNSDCLTAWQNEQFAIREQLPLAFQRSTGNGFYNFRQDPFMKYKLFEKLQQPGTDLFVFHEHGDFDTQYINGEYPAQNMLEYPSGNVVGPMTTMAVSIRNTFRRYTGDRAEKFKKGMISEYGLSEDFFHPQRLDSLKKSDSVFAADINISLKELTGVRVQPKFSIFDACYNGSFHQPGYIAGYHVFGDGNTVVAQGNTVNVLQDKWSLELLGMLAEGARVGFWQKEFQFLESHLIGDPTYRFFTEGSDKLNINLALKVSNTKIWERFLQNGNPALQALALKQLSKNPAEGFSGRLLQVFRESKYYSVRLEALKRLLDMGGQNMVEAIRLGLDDPYEFIRRISARYAGFSGDPVLIPPLVNSVLFSDESQRVQYSAQGSLEMFDLDAVINEIEKQSPGSNDLVAYYRNRQKAQEKSLSSILDKSAKPDDRIAAVRNLRNYNNHKQVGKLLEVLKDQGEDLNVRITLAEALGWFNRSINKAAIVEALKTIGSGEAAPELNSEIIQSLKRH